MTQEYSHAIIDCATNETIVRPMTAEEIAQLEAARAEILQIEKDNKDEADRISLIKESAKAKLIAGEPLTEEEAATIVL